MAKPVTRGVRNRLGEIRVRRGLAASDLARRINVTRQTIYAIEAGTYVPNTEVALNLARELEVTVDELFSLQEGAAAAADSINAEVLGSAPSVKGQPVRICQIGSHWISVPVSAAPYYLPEADGIVQRPAGRGGQAKLTVFGGDAGAGKRLILAGCDPASSFLSHMAEKAAGVEIVSAAASSKLALTWLMEGKVHIAGSHLEDPGTGEFNLPFLRSRFPDEDLAVITFARWEEGLVVAKGNPKGIRGIEDLARRNVKMANREPGSGSRGLLDRLLKDAGIESSSPRLPEPGSRFAIFTLRRARSSIPRIPFGFPFATTRPSSHRANVMTARSSSGNRLRRNGRLNSPLPGSSRWEPAI